MTTLYNRFNISTDWPDEKSLFEMLQEISNTFFGHLYIILDTLDECMAPRELWGLVRYVYKYSMTNTRLHHVSSTGARYEGNP